MFNRLLYIGAAFAAMSLAAIGQAGTLASGLLLYGDSVTINYLGNNISTSAGTFEAATFNGGAIPDFWCIDLTHTVPYPPWTLSGYTETAVSGFTATQLDNLQTLFFNNYSGSLFTDPDNAAHSSSRSGTYFLTLTRLSAIFPPTRETAEVRLVSSQAQSRPVWLARRRVGSPPRKPEPSILTRSPNWPAQTVIRISSFPARPA